MTVSGLQDAYLDWLDLSHHPEASRVLASWEYVALLEDDEVVGIAALKGTEIHFAAAPAWRGRVMSRRRIRAFLEPLMARYGFLTTRSLVGDLGSAVFLRRLGFVNTWTELEIRHWMLTALPYSREN
jgi:hypothetical protein